MKKLFLMFLMFLMLVSTKLFSQTIIVEGGKECKCFDYNRDYKKCYAVMPPKYHFRINGRDSIIIIQYEQLCNDCFFNVNIEKYSTVQKSVNQKVIIKNPYLGTGAKCTDCKYSNIITYLKPIKRA